ncbi:MAG: Gfo/Idh/MocA family oxidoreductase [Gemmataceae bacterium]|nr:Gfo/Idh/MocA family oxidoreductase [Gemmataceae bacterium]
MSQTVDRRAFLGSAAALSLSAANYAGVWGANERVGIAFVGCGGRAQAHMDLVRRLQAAGEAVAPVAVCDVWDGHEEEYTSVFGGQVSRRRYAQGLYPAARKCGLDPADRRHVTKDYRQLLELPEVDVVCIATPDHWHARMTLDALAAGKDVFVERPLGRTAAQAVAVLHAWQQSQRVVVVGVQNLADPLWVQAWDYLRSGQLGHVVQGQTGAFRNDIRGQWRFYRLVEQMHPRSIDWDMFLGHRFEVAGQPIGPSPRQCPFDRAVFAQWRCYQQFSGGPFHELLYAPVCRLLAAMGVRFPARVSAAGGLYLEYDGRTVPDVVTVAADFDEGCQLLATATTLSNYPLEELIRCRLGTIKFVRGGFQVYRDDPSRGSVYPPRLEGMLTPHYQQAVASPRHETEALWRHFLACVRQRRQSTYCPPDLAAAASVLLALAEQSLEQGLALGWDAQQQRAVSADAHWLARWRQRSHHGGKPAHILGWSGAEQGCTLQPPDYQKLANRPETG